MEKIKPLAIYGAGGLGREVASLISHINKTLSPKWDFIGFFDDNREPGYQNEYGKILGDIDTVNKWDSPLDIVIAFGSPKNLKRVYSNITNPLIEFPNIIYPDTFFLDSDRVKLGKGNIFCPFCSVSTNVTIGNFNLFNWRISIGHDALIGDFNTFMPGVKVSGETQIGNSNLFGSDSFIKQQLIIGDNITLSPLSSLLTKPKDNSLYMGNPAKIMKF